MAQRRSFKLGNTELSALTAGSSINPTVILVHGWPLTSAIWQPVLDRLGENRFVLAFDLPGIGGSSTLDVPVLKTEIAGLLLDVAEVAGARDITVAGVDVGGMVAFSAARDHGHRVARSIIMNTVIPGVEPWSKVLSNPQVWHFAFHQVPELPELLVAGHERTYFNFFLDMLSGAKEKISTDMRASFANAYASPSSLKTGFDWYRSMSEDAKINSERSLIDTPILYVRGDADPSPIEAYLEGLRAAGARNVTGKVIADSGEIVSLEQPDELIKTIIEFAAEP